MASRTLRFSKYHGAGNDFVMINDWDRNIHLDSKQVAHLCDRHMGIGADGLIMLQSHPDYDYEMVYYNADGNLGSMCGNGARCTYAFAFDNGLVKGDVRFLAYDGMHTASRDAAGLVTVSMSDVGAIEEVDDAYVLDTGSPHLVRFVQDLSEVDVVGEGRSIRNSDPYVKDGINVNFVQEMHDHVRMSTFERGVEDRTLACGTGATAVALVWAARKGQTQGALRLKLDGGEVNVSFERRDDKFTGITLQGPAQKVYDGSVAI